MGQVPAKLFPLPTPYGQSPNANVASPAVASNQDQATSPLQPTPMQPIDQPVASPFSIKNKVITGAFNS